MRLVAVGRMKPGPERDLFDRYAGRLRPALDIVERPAAKGAPAEQKRRESTSLREACPEGSFVVALDQGGRAWSSEDFAQALSGWRATGRPVCFVIGGAEGLDGSVIRRADAVLSFGAMTWPHMLVRIMLAEQLFRAQAIDANHPYHRDGRPD